MEQSSAKTKRTVDIILDTEFNAAVGNFQIDPISIAMVDACGHHIFYAVSNEFNQAAAEAHPFLPKHVLPKLPPQSARQSNAEIAEGIKTFLTRVVGAKDANRANIWAKNGGMGDFTLLALWLNDQLYPFMRSIGVEKTYTRDTHQLFKEAGYPDLSSLPVLEEADKHTALGDVLHEREVFLLCQSILEARAPTHL